MGVNDAPYAVVVGAAERQPAAAFAYEPLSARRRANHDGDELAHNCGSRHMLVAHKKGNVIVRLSTDDGRYQEGGEFGKDTLEEPQLRACLRGRSYRSRLYSPERLLYPMMRVGERGEGKFKRVSWEEALSFTANKMQELKAKYGPTALLDRSYAARPSASCTSRTRSRACSGASSACSAAAPAPGRCHPIKARLSPRA